MYVATWEILSYGLEGWDAYGAGFCVYENLEEVKSHIQYEMNNSGSNQVANVNVYEISKKIPCSIKTIQTFEVAL